jgi:adenylate kinase family enzyme
MPKVLILTGPGGAGKSTIAELLVEQCGFVLLDGDREDTEFFPDGDQWLPENTEKLRLAHEKILRKAKSLWSQGKNVVVDYIIFGRYVEFLELFQKEFGDDLEIKVLMPSQRELIKRDAERECWTTGPDRIAAVAGELLLLKEKIGADNFLNTSNQMPEETFRMYFAERT